MKRSILKKKSKNPLPKLHAKAWALMSEYVRKRDLDKGCVTCGRKFDRWDDPDWQAGHYIHMKVYDFHLGGAVNGQCKGCNMGMRNTHVTGIMEVYRQKLNERWGDGVAEEIRANRHQPYKPTRGLFEGIAIALKEKIQNLSQGGVE